MSDSKLKANWERIYTERAPTELSWHQSRASRSLAMIQRVARDAAAPIIDVGAGASPLVDDLLRLGYASITVLDLSSAALVAARERLGTDAERVRWMEADVLTAPLAESAYDVWHDRAVFHFLTEAADRARYVAQVRRAVRPHGHVIVATFAADGPAQCSGFDVARYDPDALHDEFGSAFRLVASEREEHRTPRGALQAFTYCLCRLESEDRRRDGDSS